MLHRTTRSRRTGALTALVVACSLLGAAPAAAEAEPVPDPVVDVVGPEVVDVAVEPSSLDVTDGPATVHVSLHVSDASGVVAPVSVTLEPADPGDGAAVGPVELVLVAGDALDGTHAGDVLVPASVGAGTWSVVAAALDDTVGNRTGSAAVGEVVVTRTVPDAEPPVATEGSVEPRQGDLSAGGVEVRFSVRLADPSGVVAPEVELVHTASGTTLAATLALVEGDVVDGRWAGAVTVPQGGPGGAWTARLRPVADVLGNVGDTLDLPGVTLGYSGVVGAVPTVAGTARVGSTLTATAGTWLPAPVTLTFRWKRNGVAISGATARSYVLVAADAGASVTVTVTGAKPGLTPSARTSVARVVERPLTATPTPTVAGTARVGSTLTATAGTWLPAPVTLTYQWKRNGVAISGATARTYRLVTADAGTAVAVTVRGARTGYTPVARTSAARAVEKLLTATPTPTVSGTARVGSTLTATAGSWLPSPVTLTYRWKRNGVALSATARTYTLVAADAGASITVTVTGSRTGFTPVARTSAVRAVEKLLTATPTPTVTGRLVPGSVLTAAAGTWGPAPVTLTFQWRRNGVAISGATARTYTLRAADASATVSVTVVGRRTGYTPVSRTSAGRQVAPASPGDSVNCSSFATWPQAQAWFDRYYPAYGDVARLDADNDRIACESLPGHP